MTYGGSGYGIVQLCASTKTDGMTCAIDSTNVDNSAIPVHIDVPGPMVCVRVVQGDCNTPY